MTLCDRHSGGQHQVLYLTKRGSLNFASATALVCNTGTIAGIGDEATALVLYGDGVTSDTRVAVATILLMEVLLQQQTLPS